MSTSDMLFTLTELISSYAALQTKTQSSILAEILIFTILNEGRGATNLSVAICARTNLPMKQFVCEPKTK